METFWRCLNNGNVDPPSLRVPFPPSSCLSCLGELRTDRTTDRPSYRQLQLSAGERTEEGAEQNICSSATSLHLISGRRRVAAAAGMSSWMERERGESSPDGGGDRPPRHRSVGAVATAVAALTICAPLCTAPSAERRFLEIMAKTPGSLTMDQKYFCVQTWGGRPQAHPNGSVGDIAFPPVHLSIHPSARTFLNPPGRSRHASSMIRL